MGWLYIDNTKNDNDGKDDTYNDTDDDSNDINTNCDAYKVWWHKPFSLVDLGGMPSTCPQQSRFFNFDIQNFWNITTSGVHAPPWGLCPLREILDPPMLLVMYTKWAKTVIKYRMLCLQGMLLPCSNTYQQVTHFAGKLHTVVYEAVWVDITEQQAWSCEAVRIKTNDKYIWQKSRAWCMLFICWLKAHETE